MPFPLGRLPMASDQLVGDDFNLLDALAILADGRQFRADDAKPGGTLVFWDQVGVQLGDTIDLLVDIAFQVFELTTEIADATGQALIRRHHHQGGDAEHRAAEDAEEQRNLRFVFGRFRCLARLVGVPQHFRLHRQRRLSGR